MKPHNAHYLSGYLRWLQTEKRYAAHTVSNYQRDVNTLLELVADDPLDRLNNHDIRHYIARLHGQGTGGRSLARKLSAWRSFYHYLIRDHNFEINPCNGVKAPKFAKRLPNNLSPDQACQLVSPQAATPLELRDKAMFELLYSSGLRLAELIGLENNNREWLQGELTITGKGSKQRIVPVGRYAIQALQQWLQVRAKLADPDESAMFVGSRGKRISPRVVQLQIKKLAQQQHIEGNVHPHAMRHSFASHMLQSSGDLRAVQEMLGHASITSTQVYTHLDFQYLSKIYDQAHPRARKKTS